jgi:hypothetical protein
MDNANLVNVLRYRYDLVSSHSRYTRTCYIIHVPAPLLCYSALSVLPNNTTLITRDHELPTHSSEA